MQSLFSVPTAAVKPVSTRNVGVLDQIRTSTKRKNRLAFVIGVCLGGFVPVITWTIAHLETNHRPLLWIVVTGGLMYSSLTVFDWMRAVVKHPFKAFGFVVLLESAMTFSSIQWLSLASLGILVGINAIAAACQLVMDTKNNRKQAKSLSK